MSGGMREWFLGHRGQLIAVKQIGDENTSEAMVLNVFDDFVSLRFSEGFPAYGVPFTSIAFFRERLK